MTSTTKVYTLLSKEILYRFIHFFLCFILCFISSWLYEKELLLIYLEPLLQLHQTIIYTSISEAFSTSLRLCFWISFACCLPYGVYHCFCFFLPSVFPTEKNLFLKTGLWVILLYVISFFLCRVYVIPELCFWFLKFSVSTEALSLSLQAKVSNYVSWSGKLYIITILILQAPYSFWGLLQLSIGTYQKSCLFFSQNRKYANIFILLICALISPPDVYSQGTIFFFLCGIYEYLLWYSFLNQALNSKKKQKALQNKNPTESPK